MEQIRRCEWAGPDPIYIDYHDNEWGKPLHDDNKLFEMLILEGMQAGLAWITVLKKRENFRAFAFVRGRAWSFSSRAFHSVFSYTNKQPSNPFVITNSSPSCSLNFEGTINRPFASTV